MANPYDPLTTSGIPEYQGTTPKADHAAAQNRAELFRDFGILDEDKNFGNAYIERDRQYHDLRELAKAPIDLLTRWADQIKYCHIDNDGTWGSEREAEEDYNEIMSAVKALRAAIGADHE